MIRALVEKEIRQHGSMIFLFLILINAGMLILQSNQALALSGGSGFAIVAWMLLVILPLGCLVLGNALIAVEFRQKTQIFLDGLPLPRWKMVAVKYVFGLGVTLLSSLLLLGTAILGAWRSEALNTTFIVLLILKTVGWSWFCWSAIFALSFLGRYRMVIGLAVVLGLIWMQQAGGILVNRIGPFELISDRFAYERSEVPIQELWITAGLIAALTCVGFALALVRDATLATMLSEKMSSRERLVVISLVIAGLMILGSVAERVEKTDPLDLPDSIDLVVGPATVSTAAAVSQPTNEERTALQAHADEAAATLQSVADYLKIDKLPPLFLLHRRDLAIGEFQSGDLDSRQGYLLRLNMIKTVPSSPVLRSQVIDKVLDVHQHYRLDSDSRGWIVKGFSYWWPRRDSKEQGDAPALEKWKSYREIELTADDLVHWKRFRKSRGEGFEEGMFAAVGIETLSRKDPNACREFLSGTLGYSAPHDVRASVHDWWYSTPSMMKKVLNMDLRELAQQWRATMQSSESYPFGVPSR
jgi:hypothetical protein